MTNEPRDGGAGVDDWDLHWGSFGEAAKENPANRYRQHLIIKMLGQLTEGACVLDIGSGQGELALSLKSRYPAAQVQGLEYSAEGVRRSIARATEAHLDVRFSQRDLLLPSPLAREDQHWATHAVCSEVLEHLDHPEQLLDQVRGYLAPNCHLLVTVPGGPRSAFDHHIGHRQHYSAEQLRRLLDRAGYDVVRILRAGFPFFNLYKLGVIARGTRLIQDATPSRDNSLSSAPLTALLALFNLLFRANLSATPWGWQMVAEARPSRSSESWSG